MKNKNLPKIDYIGSAHFDLKEADVDLIKSTLKDKNIIE